MSNWKSILRDAGYFGVGAAAVIIEAGGKAVSALVRKGEKTLRDNQDTVDDLKRKAKDLGGKMKDAVEKAAVKPEKPPVDASTLSAEERAELRRQLDEADAACEPDCTCEADAACGTDAACEPDCTCEADAACEAAPEEARPVVPDVIYHTAAPVPEEVSGEDAPDDESPADDETING